MISCSFSSSTCIFFGRRSSAIVTFGTSIFFSASYLVSGLFPVPSHREHTSSPFPSHCGHSTVSRAADAPITTVPSPSQNMHITCPVPMHTTHTPSRLYISQLLCNTSPPAEGITVPFPPEHAVIFLPAPFLPVGIHRPGLDPFFRCCGVPKNRVGVTEIKNATISEMHLANSSFEYSMRFNPKVKDTSRLGWGSVEYLM